MATMEEYAKQPADQRLKRLERTADELAAAIKGQSAATLTKRPDAKNWAAVEIICHLRDADEAFDLFEGKNFAARQKPHVFIRHAIEATDVATVSHA